MQHTQKRDYLQGIDGPTQAVLSSAESISPTLESLAYPPLEIQPLITSGPSENRVDLVFFSDGYLAEEKGKFIEDAKRLAGDISNNQTFNTVKPLLNFWAAFSPSNESGVGTGGKPKDTPFGLYRDGTELRGVYYAKPDAARAACLSMGDQCDFPILMGNDPLYGGLGGEFTVITPSLANGALVLRHELGHSIIDVGEEYDGGYAYFGVNALRNHSAPVSWAHWLTNTSSHHTRPERSVMPMQAYAWTLLNVSTPWAINFSASGLYSRHLVRFSLSGIPEAADLTVEIDGENLNWKPMPDIGVDRWHYDIHRNGGLSDGVHEVKFKLENEDREGEAQLCSAEILEFGDENEFVSSPGHYGLFPTFSEKNTTTYRPTNEDCLMRIVTTPNFCKVCAEGLWLALLQRVDLIDSAVAGCARDSASGQWSRTLDLNLVPLAQFRSDAVAPSESYTIKWSKDGLALEEFANKTRVELDDAEGRGLYLVEVTFATEEVLEDEEGLLTSRGAYLVIEQCDTLQDLAVGILGE
ncbi:hypothetical protein EW026_g255 [Hermanssonia centrifuga]|uniref:IgA peptidase M64-domain-containing protein n=1 Tax=Hermanssonia centrifuga TaxID=98765 RepID=A0A4V6S130_9APHY|nr:hypothetical protein EW026_g255 [Hermanssonia centrifuga]